MRLKHLMAVLFVALSLTLLTVPPTRADDGMWCGPDTADLYCTDDLTRLPMKYQSQARFIASDGGLAGYARYTFADTPIIRAHRHHRRHAYRGVGVTFDGGHPHVFLGKRHYWQNGLKKYEPTGPVIVERVRVPDGITTRTDIEVTRDGQPLLIRRGGTAVRE